MGFGGGSRYGGGGGDSMPPRRDDGFGHRSGGGGGMGFGGRDGGRESSFRELPPRAPAGGADFGGPPRGSAGPGFASTFEQLPLPDRPPYTAHIGNLSFDANEGDINEFFQQANANVKSVRLVRDRELDRPRGFGYVEFEDLDSLKAALDLSGQPLVDRPVRVTVADAPKSGGGGFAPERDLDWGAARSTRGPLPPLENQRGGYGAPRDFDGPRRDGPREPREPREPERELDWGAARTKGPLPPPAATAERRGSDRGYQRAGRDREAGAENNEFGERRERRPFERREPREAGPELDWGRKGPLPPREPRGKAAAEGAQGEEAPAKPAERKKLNLAPRTATEDGASTPAAAASPVSNRASPFGGARAVDTGAAEKRAEEKRIALQKEREAAAAQKKAEGKEYKEARGPRNNGNASGKGAKTTGSKPTVTSPAAASPAPTPDAATPAVAATSTAAAAAAPEESRARKFDPRTDRPFDLLSKTEGLSIDDENEVEAPKAVTQTSAAQAPPIVSTDDNDTEGWSTVRK